MKKLILLVLTLAFPLMSFSAPLELHSPDGRLSARLETGEAVSLIVSDRGNELYRIDNIAMHTDRGTLPAPGAKIRKQTRSSVDRRVIPVVKEKNAEIPENYNQMRIDFRDGVSIEVRAYDDGIAYRLVTGLGGELTVLRETGTYIFPGDYTFVFQRDSDPGSSCENPYVTTSTGKLTDRDMGNLPALVEIPGSRRLLMLESDVQDYPVLWLRTDNGRLNMYHWEYPASYLENGNYYNRRQVTARHEYIARVGGSRSFPWRVMAVADDDAQLMSNQLVWLLAPDCMIEDPSWIKPGWVIFDWWAKMGVFGVDFKAGMNTATAKYMIDFAQEFEMPYFLFDDGWTREDLTVPVPEVDIEEVVTYAGSKGVDVMLWVSYAQLYDQMDEAFRKFEQWGIKGIKIDFMNRSDQEIVRFYWDVSEKAARHGLVVNFHGAYKPDGIRRAYPNVLTREALIEFEFSGVNDWVSPDHNCTLPFIRNVAGPMDYIPGTMMNATRSKFSPIGQTPMGMGTRTHSMAMAVVFESPMQMVPDSPSVYYREEECARFLFAIPVEWDEIRPLDGKVGDYVAVARRNGSDWYVGAITDWTPRNLVLELDFLDEGREYTMEFFRDGINADMSANDYKREISKVRKGDKIDTDMAPGGGWVARISR